jgi:hypothetical protein
MLGRSWVMSGSLLLAACGSRSGLLGVGDEAPLGSGGVGGGGGVSGIGGSGVGGNGGAGGVTPQCAPSGGPTELANGVEGAHAIAVDGTHVYFTIAKDGGSLFRVPKLGGAKETIATGLGRPRHLALWQDDVFVSSPMNGEVVRAKRDGSGQSVFHDGPPYPRGIAVNELGLAWLRSSVNGGELWRTGPGLAPSEAFTLLVDLPSPEALALDGPEAFFVDNGSGLAAASVRRVDLLTGSVQIWSELPTANAQDIALDADWVYVTMNAWVFRIPRSGGTTELIGEGVFLRGLSIAGDRMFWAERGASGTPSQVVRRWLSSGAIEIVAAGQAEPEGVANDGQCVYWTNSGGLGQDGSVYAAPL